MGNGDRWKLAYLFLFRSSVAMGATHDFHEGLLVLIFNVTKPEIAKLRYRVLVFSVTALHKYILQFEIYMNHSTLVNIL